MNTQMNTRPSQHIFNSSICRILFATCLSALCLIQLSIQAATITVTSTNDSGAGSLRQALADAVDGDMINFDAALNGQTIALTSGELLVDKSVTISGPAENTLAIDANHASRVFYIASGKDVTILGVTIENGSGLGLFGFGGGIYNDRSTLTVNNCTFSGNSSSRDGGGIYNCGVNGSATLSLNSCTLSGNSAEQGGGVCNDGYQGSATLAVTNSTLSSNAATIGGGGIYNDGANGSATLTVNSSTVSDNSGTYWGGGIRSDGGGLGSAALTVTNSTLSGNSASGGGGVYNAAYQGNATFTITNSTFSGNSAPGDGGAIYNYSGGGGIAAVTIGDTILNAGASGYNVTNSGTINSLGYNLCSDGCGFYLTAPGDRNNADPMLGSLQDNGGPTFSHALLPGSPAIDAGDPNFTAPPDYDQRGPGFPRVLGARIDIGALEVPPIPTPTPTPTPTSTPTPAYAGQVQPPINADGASTFSVRRGVVPVKFNLTLGGVATCDLPPATIAVTRTAGGVMGPVNESLYSGNADIGSNFRIDSCQYVYNLNSSALGVGTYRVDILIDGQVVGSATFGLN